MARDELVTASETLEQAATDVGAEYQGRIEEQSESLRQLSERDRGPDQGRLDRHMNILTEIYEATGNEDIERALEHVREYRTGVGGV